MNYLREERLPYFSVVLPTHNRCAILPRSIRSVLDQTFTNFELIVINDGSVDATEDALKAFRDRRLRIHRHETPRGVAAARNAGLRASSGNFVALLDDDDEFVANHLQNLYDLTRTAPPDVGFGWSGIRWMRSEKNGPIPLREEVWNPKFGSRLEAYHAFLQNRHIGSNCGVFFRRSIFGGTAPFDEDFHGGAEDTDLFIRLARDFDFVVNQKIGVIGHLHSGPSLRKVSVEKARDYEKLIAKHYLTLASSPELWRALHYKTGWLYIHSGHKSAGRNHLLRLIRRRPLHKRSWVALALSFLPGTAGPRLHRLLSAARSRKFPLSPPTR